MRLKYENYLFIYESIKKMQHSYEFMVIMDTMEVMAMICFVILMMEITERKESDQMEKKKKK